MENRSAKQICEDKLTAIDDELDGPSKDKAFQLMAMFADFLLFNMKGAGSIPISSAGSTTPSTGMICPKCNQPIKVMLTP